MFKDKLMQEIWENSGILNTLGLNLKIENELVSKFSIETIIIKIKDDLYENQKHAFKIVENVSTITISSYDNIYHLEEKNTINFKTFSSSKKALEYLKKELLEIKDKANIGKNIYEINNVDSIFDLEF